MKLNRPYQPLLLIAIITLALFSGCSDSRDSFFTEPNNNQKLIKYDSLSFDVKEILLSNTSYVGYTDIRNDSIYFLDKYFCFLYVIDKEQNIVGRHLGQGRGRNEVPLKNAYGYAIDENGNHILMSTTNDIYTISPVFEYLGTTFYHYFNIGNEMNPVYKQLRHYCPIYEDLYINFFRGKLYIAVEGSSNDLIDFTQVGEKWYKHSRIIMEIDKEKGKVERVFGRISPNVPMCTAVYGHFFKIDEEGNFYVAYQADTLIYKYNNDYNILSAFGFDGVNMTKNYKKLPTELKEINTVLFKELEDKGYFTSISLANGYLFRTYRTGGNNNQDRMQIYKDEVLVGDVAIPEQFKVAGYIEPYFYSNIVCNEDSERLTIYKFKLY